ncbi:MAG TPA: NADH-quinone oxidoreductase subunit N [Verrucomicrobiae bacterium]
MNSFNYAELLIRLLPHAILIVGALIALFADQLRPRTWNDWNRSTTAVLIGLVSIIAAILVINRQTEFGSFYNGMLQVTQIVRFVQVSLLILTAATLITSTPEKFTNHIGEYVALILMAAVGLLLLAGTHELLTAFIALELVSLSLYLLTAFRKDSIYSAEAGLKYFLFGSVAAAFTLFGISLVFGLAGSTEFGKIGAALEQQQLSPMLTVALVLMAVGFGFKMAAAPLHLWAPDAYQGAPAPSAALIASASKLASFLLFLKFFFLAAPTHAGSAAWNGAISGWAVLIAALAATSIIVGNILALAQTNIRRIIAYSAIAHGGYVLIALLAPTRDGVASSLYYLFTYGLAVVGIFGVIGLIEERHGELSFSDLRGLSRRSPLAAISLLVFVLSLAGIPPLAGFFGKFYVFLAALDASRVGNVPGLLWLVILAIAGSAVSLYYYLLILKHAFVVGPAEGAAFPPISAAPVQKLTLALLAAAVILLGIFPNVVLHRLGIQSPAPEQHHDQAHPHQESSLKSPHLFGNLG